MKKFVVRTGLTTSGFSIILSGAEGDVLRVFPFRDCPNFTVKQFVNYVARLQSCGYEVEFLVDQ